MAYARRSRRKAAPRRRSPARSYSRSYSRRRKPARTKRRVRSGGRSSPQVVRIELVQRAESPLEAALEATRTVTQPKKARF